MKTPAISQSQKRKLYLYFFFNLSALLILLLLNQCTDKVEATRTYTFMKPVYMTTSELRQSIDVLPPRTIQSAGKIYYLNNHIFLNDPGEGIHIIDNNDPRNPTRVAFINIPGNFDMAAAGTTLYADSFIDLLVFDISDLNNIQMKQRVENVFPRYTSYGGFPVEDEQVITEWVEEEVTEVIEGNMDPLAEGMFFYEGGIAFAQQESFVNFAMDAGGGMRSSTGVGGSMARFAIDRDHLYTIDDYSLQVFDISQRENPQELGENIQVGFMIETIFPYEEKLFIGAQAGMHIYDNSDPANPQHLSTYEHITSCDPVVVEGNTAYVTLRNGTECQGFVNQLEVIDVENPSNPQLVATYQMAHPHGLGIDDGTLFICEGEYGLKVFDARDRMKIDDNQLAYFDNLHAYDVIPLGNVLMMIGEDGLYQYDYSDPTNIKELSVIPVPKL